MMLGSIASWTLVALAGLALAVTASQWAVRHAGMLAHGLSIPPFLLGLTFFALGTDVPEIANSVMSSIAGHGDLNVGDSVGSVVTQITLILGLLPFVGGRLEAGRKPGLLAPVLTVVALAVGVVLVADGRLGRFDGGLLIAGWVLALGALWRYAPSHSDAELPAPTRHKAVHAAMAAGSLALVIVGAGAAVQGIVKLSAAAGIPEYLISFFGSSVGTSLPEIVFSIVAVRRGQRDLAFGDVFGACLTDATLSIGVGPAVAPTAVTADLAVRGSLFAMAAMAASVVLLWYRPRFDRISGAALLALYGFSYVVLGGAL
jgi:cation:H+ antiporter